MYSHNGFALPITLIFLFVMTLIVIAQTELSVSETKTQLRMQYHDVIFYRAEAGLIQAEENLLGISVTLPDSPISLKTTIQQQDADFFEKKLIDIDSVAFWNGQRVELRSRDIFVRVPKPAYQRLFWQEGATE